MKTFRCIAAGMAKMLVGLFLLELSLEAVSDPGVREQMSGNQITRGARDLTEGVLRDVDSLRRGEWM